MRKAVYGLLVLTLMGCSDGRSTAEVRAPSPSDLPTVSPTVDLQLPDLLGQLGTPAGIGSDQHEVTVEDGRSAGARAVPEAPSTADPILPPSTYVLTREEVYDLALSVSGSPSWAREATEVAWCESRWRMGKVGAAGEEGLFQVRAKFHGPVPSDALGQTEQAWAVWSEAGWRLWSCKP